MPLTRRTFVAGIGALSVASVAPVLATTATVNGILVNREDRVLSFLQPITRYTFKRALRTLKVPHNWALSDSVVLHGWTIDTPQLARGFGWSSLDQHGSVSESWAELVVESFDNDREFDVTVGEFRSTTDGGSLHFRCERFPNVQIHDLTGRSGRRDHLQLLSKEGTPARAHRLVAVA